MHLGHAPAVMRVIVSANNYWKGSKRFNNQGKQPLIKLFRFLTNSPKKEEEESVIANARRPWV